MEAKVHTKCHLPVASRRQIFRSLLKDKTYSKLLLKQVEEVVTTLLGPQNATRYKVETEAIVELCYEFLARNARKQTLGQEDCDLLPMVHPEGHVPSNLHVGMLILFKIGFPYAAEKLSTSSNSFSLLGRQVRPDLQKKVSSLILGAEQACLILFFISGFFPQLGHRLSKLTFYTYDEVGKQRKGEGHYKLLGLLLAVSTVSGMIGRALKVVKEEGEKDSEVPKAASGKDEGGAATAEKPEHETKCPLCLSNLESSASTPCGHIFCWSCILDWCNRKQECPLCRANADARDLVCMFHSQF